MTTALADDGKILASKFARLRNLHDVAALLEVPPRTLGFYLHKAANYKTFKLQKRSGGARVITTPSSPLKIIQKKLNQVLQAVYRGRGPVHGFVHDRSIVTNARQHLNKGILLNFDIENFFPSIHFGRVLGLFEQLPYSLPRPAALVLAQICCHQGSLPVGAPTSPVVANMICGKMDSELKSLARAVGCRYTRYADDLTFSTQYNRFHPDIALFDIPTRKWRIGDGLTKVIETNQFKINNSKTRVLPRGSKQEVTGIIVGDRANVKRNFIRQVRAMLHAAERHGVKAAETEFHSKYDRRQRLHRSPSFLRVLRGKIEFVGAVRGRDDIIYLRLLDRYIKLDPKAGVKPIIAGPTATMEVLERAVWLMDEVEGPIQGTAFAAEGIGLLTAAHVLTATTKASCPPASLHNQRITIVKKEDHVDVARATLPVRLPVLLRIAPAQRVKPGDAVKVLGFPMHRDGGSMHVNQGRVTATSPWHGVPHVVVDCNIIRGNSGGPVLNNQNEVIGIAVKGQGIPKRFNSDDELSRYVPIDFALKYL